MKESEVRSPVNIEDRTDILQMIDHGWKDEEILEAMPHIERGSVTAFRAHVTRGTYSQGDYRWKKK